MSLLLKTKLLVYTAYIRLQVSYEAEAWAFLSESNMRRLQVIQKKALHIIRGYDINTRVARLESNNDISTLHTYNRQQAEKFYNNFTDNQNTT